MFIVRGLGGRGRGVGCERKWGFRKWGRGCEGGAGESGCVRVSFNFLKQIMNLRIISSLGR